MKALFGDISGIGTDCITVWKARKIAEVADEAEAKRICTKEGYSAYVIPALLTGEGVTLRIVGVAGFSPTLNPVPSMAPRKEKAR